MSQGPTKCFARAVDAFQMVWHLNQPCQQHFGENCHCAKAAWPKNDAAQNATILVGSIKALFKKQLDFVIAFAFNCPHQSIIAQEVVGFQSQPKWPGSLSEMHGKNLKLHVSQSEESVLSAVQRFDGWNNTRSNLLAPTSAANPHFEFSLSPTPQYLLQITTYHKTKRSHPRTYPIKNLNAKKN